MARPFRFLGAVMPFAHHRHFVALLLPLSACASPPSQQPDRNTAIVDVVPVHAAGGALRQFSGVVRPYRETMLAFKRPGRVLTLTVQVGDTVRAGQVLGRLGKADADAGAAQAEAELAAATADARTAQDAADRSRGLDGIGALSSAEVRQRALAARAAAAKVAAAAAVVRRSRDMLSDAVLVAPQAGVVTARLTEPGSVVEAGSAVLKLASGAPEVEIHAPADLRLTSGMMADVGMPGRAGTFTARLRRLAPEGDPTSHLRDARFVLSGTGSPPPYNSIVTLTLRTPTPDQQVRVPLSAIGDADRRPYVWTLQPDSHIRRQPVRIAAWLGRDALVTGLRDGQSIVATAADTLVDGQSVVDAGIEPGFH